MSAGETSAPPAARESVWRRLLRLRRGPWEGVATAIIAVGVVMLMQSLAMALFSWSFVTILTGTAMFVIVSHFRD